MTQADAEQTGVVEQTLTLYGSGSLVSRFVYCGYGAERRLETKKRGNGEKNPHVLF